MRAFIFTVDSVLALIPAFIILGAVSTISTAPFISMQSMSMEMNHRAEDALAVLEKQGTVDEFARMFTNYTKLYTDGDAAWATEKSNLLTLANTTLSPLMPAHLGYAVEFWGRYANGTEYLDTEFSTDNRSLTGGANRPFFNATQYAGAATKLASGYEKARLLAGCVARAELSSMSKTKTQVFPFYMSGSGWGATNAQIEKTISLPSDAVISNAILYISLHANEVNDPITITVNGNNIAASIVWYYQPATDAPYGIANVTNRLAAGTNVIRIDMSMNGYHAHIHPGMKLEVTYETSQDTTTYMSQRFYFDYVSGGTGAWQNLDFHVPQGATVSSARLYLHVEGIDTDENTIRLNTNILRSGVLPGTPGTYDETIDITSYLQTGTNVVATEFDADVSGDAQYGGGTTRISNASYVEINYAYLPQTTYGYLDLTRVIQFTGAPQNPKTVNFSIPSYHDTIYEAFVYPTERFSWYITAEAWAQGDAPTTVFTSPDARVVPARVFINPSTLEANKTNYVRLTDSCGGCDFLNGSSVEYTFLIPKQVPFGQVFAACSGHRHTVYYDMNYDGTADGSVVLNPSLSSGFDSAVDAKDDALQRLLDELNFYVPANASGASGSSTNPIDIELTSVSFEAEEIGNVPFMWGPLKIRIRVWG